MKGAASLAAWTSGMIGMYERVGTWSLAWRQQLFDEACV